MQHGEARGGMGAKWDEFFAVDRRGGGVDDSLGAHVCTSFWFLRLWRTIR